jgi:uncharacterized protein (DUF427 family)
MALTFGTSPFGARPRGRFNAELELPDPLLWFEAYPLRVRAVLAGEVVADSTRVALLHSSEALPVFWFPVDDLSAAHVVRGETTEVRPGLGRIAFHDLAVGPRTAAGAVRASVEPAPGAEFLTGHASLDWDAMDEWFVEEQLVLGHPKDPYTRIDVVPTTRHVQVSIDGIVVADSRRAKILQETSLPWRFYLPPEDVRTDLLRPSGSKSRCAYKGSASYWHARVGDRVVEDVVWAYAEPTHEAMPVRDLLCFFSERVDIDIDGVREARPPTQWSRKREDVVGGGQALRGLMGRRD